MDLRKNKKCASKCTDYVLLFNRSSGSPTVQYLVVDRSGRSTRLLPKLSTTDMRTVENVVGYRVVVLAGFLYVVGGRQIKSGSYVNMCNRYDPKNGQWTRRASLNEPRTAFTVNALGGRLYACGGRLRDGSATGSVECYDPAVDEWTEVRPMPTPRAYHASCVAVGRLFVCGGVADDRTTTNTLWQYDPASDFWSQADDKSSSLPRVRQRHLMTEYKGRLYCFSGVTVIRNGRRIGEREDEQLTSFDCTKGNIDTKIIGVWDGSLPRLPEVRADAGCVVLGHAIYVLGGRRYSEKRDVLQVDRYSIKGQKWTECFSLGEANFTNVECCVLRVPASNPHFSSLSRAISNKWVMW